MSIASSPVPTLTYRHLSSAAQNIAAAEFSLHGFDVLEQAGRALHSHDLSVATSSGMMKVIVHGSLDGLWDLVDPYLVESSRPQKSEYHQAINRWRDRHNRTTCCLVHFDSLNLVGMPRIYLASAAEVAERLHENVDADGEMALRADSRVSGGACCAEGIPRKWKFSQERISELMSAPKGQKPLSFRISAAEGCKDCAESSPAKCSKCLPMMN
jgi:hypothetical protein